ncbi:hypothetical protein [Bacillus sp. JCM 19041]|uniref:hypothetical protein n=1 Tax=Bacillus sp. JCM 19041 TaxID=1460637 RepID=UPI0006CF5F18
MANFPKINNVLEESTNVEVEKELSHFRSKVLAFYKHETFSDHIDYLNAEIKKLKEESMFWPIYSNDVMTNILAIKIIANENLVMDRYFDFLIKMYTYAPTYDCADLAFDKLISTNYKKFSVEQIKNFIEGASENNQCYDRRAASYDHKLVLEFIRTLESNYVPPKNF